MLLAFSIDLSNANINATRDCLIKESNKLIAYIIKEMPSLNRYIVPTHYLIYFDIKKEFTESLLFRGIVRYTLKNYQEAI
ncbi:hypothetical protein BIY23_01545 [Wolbachia pipientis]|uniref:Uncharacterized protein n=1 Tax=Wolbachia pipientis TaxID=955 RepID=A0A1E7QLP8_WOLPI|nr:hypothetical protein [Wolbachia pipientis]OEY87144.1 hypothetical protein BIY23_01545 [Wolbachia pipientis]